MMQRRKTLLGAGLLLLASVGAGAGDPEADVTAARADDEAALRHLKTELWPRAYRTGDTALLDALLHDSFQLITADGERSDKARELAWIADNEWDPGAFEYRIERLDIYGDMAIVAGEGVASRYRYRSSNVLIRDRGRWRAVASHVSGYEPLP